MRRTKVARSTDATQTTLSAPPQAQVDRAVAEHGVAGKDQVRRLAACATVRYAAGRTTDAGHADDGSPHGPEAFQTGRRDAGPRAGRAQGDVTGSAPAPSRMP